MRLTGLGREALARGDEEEPNQEVLRLFASVLRYPPAWVAYWQGDPGSLNLVLPEPMKLVLQQAELLDTPSIHDLEAWAWWDALGQVPSLDDRDAHRKAIGNAAEELSLSFEKARLTTEGFAELAKRVRWVAQESPSYGFDILSFCGSSLRCGPPSAPIAIEVKGMALTLKGEFRMWLTRHEWQTSVKLGERYLLHLWDGVHPGADRRAAHQSPMLLRSDSLRIHIPRSPECEGAREWDSAYISLVIAK